MNRRSRRASIYIITVGTTLIVAVMGYSALTLVRVQRRSVVAGNDSVQAAAFADASLEIALHRIESQANWRTKLENKHWETDQTMAYSTGAFQFAGTDPTDGNLTDSSWDPVLITATGKQGESIQLRQALIEFRNPGIRSLEPALHANGNITIDGAVFRSDTMISSNASVSATNTAFVYGNVEAAGSITASLGAVFHGNTTTAGTWPRTMPNIAKLLPVYTALGTTLDFNSLPEEIINLVTNPGTELGTTGWQARGSATIQGKESQPHSGLYSIRVKGRNKTTDGIGQDMSGQLTNGTLYRTELWIYAKKADNFRVAIEFTTEKGTGTLDLTGWGSCPKNVWTKVAGQATLSWVGSLMSATWYVESQNNLDDFNVDDGVLRPVGNRLMENILLSPGNNPLGGSKNSNGVYVIDCGGNDLSIKNCRFEATLAVMNAGTVTVSDSIYWTPAKTNWRNRNEYNLPALVVEGDILLRYSNLDLNELTSTNNFNPTSTPYFGSTDATNDDVYPSEIHGFIYSTGDINFENQCVIRGKVLAHGSISVTTGAMVEITDNRSYFEYNAPPGFSAGIKPRVVPGSIKKITN